MHGWTRAFLLKTIKLTQTCSSEIKTVFKGKWQQKFLSSHLKETSKLYNYKNLLQNFNIISFIS